jgi:chemotaxis protein methyltransferase WspC
MTPEAVAALIQARTGLDPVALGPGAIVAAVAARARALGLGPADYLARLGADSGEFLSLCDEVIIPESWFFRGGDLFFYLAEHVRTVAQQRGGKPPFRVLSVPCSTGEEPYSLALALTEAGVPAPAWSIEGVDLSPRVLALARRGLFPDLSFRQLEAGLKGHYFRVTAEGWEIAPALRSAVQFRQGNLIEPGFLAGAAPFDLVFCRNLFIYLHPAARQQALATLDRLLAPEGLLCMGHAEPLDLSAGRFSPAGPSGFFLYRRARPALPAPAIRPGSTPALLPPRADARGSPADARGSPALWPRRADVPVPRLEAPLARARRLADAGLLDQALAVCRAQQATTGPSADLFSLMGLIHQARREAREAGDCYRKALYLDPEHAEALTHLMLLCEQQGDREQAARLRRRLGRGEQAGI